MENNLLIKTVSMATLTVLSSLAIASVADPRDVLEPDEIIQNEKVFVVDTTVGELGGIGVSAPVSSQNLGSFSANSDRPIRTILRSAFDDLIGLKLSKESNDSTLSTMRIRDREERVPFVISYSENVNFAPAEKAIEINKRSRELKELPKDAKVKLTIGYTLSTFISSSFDKDSSKVSCYSNAKIKFRFMVQEPTGLLDGIVFYSWDPIFRKYEGVVKSNSVDAMAFSEALAQECISKLNNLPL